MRSLREDLSPDTAAQTTELWEALQAKYAFQIDAKFTNSRADIGARSGLQFMLDVQSGVLARPPIGATLGFTLVDVAPGRVIFQGRPDTAYYNPIGSVHGGWFCTLLDSALACAVQTLVPQGKGYTTLEIKVNMLRPITVGTGLIRAEGRAVHVGGQTGIAEGELYDSAGKIYAHATTTCLIFPLPT